MGVMHRRWAKLFVKVRYIAEEDDLKLYRTMCAALEKYGIEKHKVRHFIRYGDRRIVFRVSKACGMTRQQGRAYLKFLSEMNEDFKKKPFEKKVTTKI